VIRPGFRSRTMFRRRVPDWWLRLEVEAFGTDEQKQRLKERDQRKRQSKPKEKP